MVGLAVKPGPSAELPIRLSKRFSAAAVPRAYTAVIVPRRRFSIVVAACCGQPWPCPTRPACRLRTSAGLRSRQHRRADHHPIGILRDSPSPRWDAVPGRLAQLDWIEGQNLTVEYRWTDGKLALSRPHRRVDPIESGTGRGGDVGRRRSLPSKPRVRCPSSPLWPPRRNASRTDLSTTSRVRAATSPEWPPQWRALRGQAIPTAQEAVPRLPASQS
jgi:hypothetical protein